MQQYLNYRMRLVLGDGRELIGQFMAFDKHMNVVLGDVEEYRRVGGRGNKEAQVLKRSLGLLLLRGESIVSLSVEGPPPPDSARSRTSLPGMGGPGLGRAAGRGVGLPPVVAAAPSSAPVMSGAPVRGLGGPAPSAMQPRGPPPPGFPPGPPPGFPHGAPPPGFPGPGAPPFPPGGVPPPGFRGGPPPGFPPGMPPPGFPGGPPPGFRGGPPPGFPPGMGPPPGFGRGMPPQ